MCCVICGVASNGFCRYDYHMRPNGHPVGRVSRYFWLPLSARKFDTVAHTSLDVGALLFLFTTCADDSKPYMTFVALIKGFQNHVGFDRLQLHQETCDVRQGTITVTLAPNKEKDTLTSPDCAHPQQERRYVRARPIGRSVRSGDAAERGGDGCSNANGGSR